MIGNGTMREKSQYKVQSTMIMEKEELVMAMITCPECGKEISDKSKKCIHCGKILEEEVVPKKFCSECGKEVEIDALECPYCGCPLDEDEKELKQQKLKKVKKIGIVVAIIAVIAIIVGVILNIIKTGLNEDEQLAYQNAVELQGMLKNPDSFKLYDEFFILKHYDDDGNMDYTYTIFEYGGTNGYGALTTDEAVFRDGEYIMDYADEPDEDDYNYMKELEAKANLALYVLSGGDSDTWEKVDIDVEKIKKKMGLE